LLLVQDKLAYFRIKELKDVLIHLALPKHGKKQVTPTRHLQPPILTIPSKTAVLPIYFVNLTLHCHQNLVNCIAIDQT
jgi:hypothetical protein